MLILYALGSYIKNASKKAGAVLLSIFSAYLCARYVFARNAVTKQSRFYTNLGLFCCARNDKQCIYMHDLCLTRQPRLFRNLYITSRNIDVSLSTVMSLRSSPEISSATLPFSIIIVRLPKVNADVMLCVTIIVVILSREIIS